MNIIQLHERVRFWVDVVSSTRFESSDIDNALNIAVSSKVRESYDQNMPINKSDAFQRVQRLRDELGPIVKLANVSNGLSLSYDSSETTITISATDYGWLLALKVKDKDLGENWHNVRPISFDRKNIIERNPFRRIKLTPDEKNYFYEQSGKIIISSLLGELIDAELDYLAIPAIMNYGIEYGPAKSFSNNTSVIAVTEVVYNSLTYKIGDKFNITVPTVQITSGTVVSDFVECDIRQTTHEEISRRAAINLLLTASEVDKARALREEIMAS